MPIPVTQQLEVLEAAVESLMAGRHLPATTRLMEALQQDEQDTTQA